MTSEELCFLSIADASRLLRERELSPTELTDAYLQRIDALDDQTHAYITVTGELARQQAQAMQRELEAGRRRGALHGIPFGLKDMFATRGILTSAHSRVLANNIPAQDATVVSKLYDAGAILLGKQSSHEFAHGGPSFDLPWPPARNPWNTAHYTGSSSTGSGAAVAGGLSAFALGTDTGGSVRTPAWMCGVVGLKPTFGWVSRHGVIAFSPSCDHVGPLARTVEDCAMVLNATAGRDERDPGSTHREAPDFAARLGESIRGMRIGVLRHHWEEDIHPSRELCSAVDDALRVLRELGATTEEVRVRSLHEYYAVRIMLTESELFARHQHHLQRHAGDYGEHFLGRALAACLFTSADYLAAQRERRRIIDEMQPFYARYDAFVTTGAGPAPHMSAHRNIGAAQKWSTPSMGTMFSLTGAPALALPCGFSAGGLPLGMQIAGRPFEDATVLQIGHAYEQATGWFRRHPKLEPGAIVATIEPEHAHIDITDVAPDVREQVAAAVRHAGLQLEARQLALLIEAAPHAIDMARRLPRDIDMAVEPAAAFTLDH
ncbi:MAG TPA: amidase [Casimicrobiaceae bacterium]|nr:amidase [Casimicrobiaceae bacterium]